MSFRAFPNITPNEPWSRVTAAILQWVRNGKTNNVGEFTLTASSATTTITDALIGPDSTLGDLMPMHADAAAELPYISFGVPTMGAVVVTHPNNALTTRKFRYSVTG